MNKYFVSIIIILGIIISFFVYQRNLDKKETLLSQVVYSCDGEKQIEASYYEKVKKPEQKSGEPPVPVGRVNLKFNNGNVLDLKQTISASGVRYANSDESYVFWNKGNAITFLESNIELNYKNCIDKSKQDFSGLSKDYKNDEIGFSIKIPPNFTVDEKYKYEPLPSMSIPGIKFTISEDLHNGTNLSSDSYISVEKIKDMGSVCSGDKFLYASEPLLTQTVGSKKYSVAHSIGAGAGNRYEETVYAAQNGNDCIGIRYMVHYSVIENYPAGAVKEFDSKALKDLFDSIRQTVVLN